MGKRGVENKWKLCSAPEHHRCRPNPPLLYFQAFKARKLTSPHSKSLPFLLFPKKKK